MTFPMIGRFFLHLSKMGLFLPKFLVKKIRNYNNDLITVVVVITN
jgi:hypothetical protein